MIIIPYRNKSKIWNQKYKYYKLIQKKWGVK